ncbi:hypothetical protein QBC47DRAFT_55239 [Echria macrotheca]|uniref:Uncharacterized protein n=1 Tax=Echria macrotheca TaxID=438768 RepID=A0AAJ0F9P1_9PEZI|nr:hypothetical protein QBC47DRAFT_55239 [Echria macrotheca]
MCYQLVELYAACRCLYYEHAIDRCAAHGRPGHGIQRRTILIGYACTEHSCAISGSTIKVGITARNAGFLMRYCHRSLTRM